VGSWVGRSPGQYSGSQLEVDRRPGPHFCAAGHFVTTRERAFSPSAKQSSARPAWFRSTLPLETSWLITRAAATGFCAAHRLPVSFSTITAAVWMSLRFVEHSTVCRGRSVRAGRRITRVRGFTIFGTDSPSVCPQLNLPLKWSEQRHARVPYLRGFQTTR
jgi:hypothetical protein